MAGKLIFVSGLSGSGKTTLISEALKAINNLSYLKTSTTRPMRPDEAQSIEYDFVTAEEYERLMQSSHNWDHTEYKGFNYGANIANTTSKLAKNKHVICSVVPDRQIIDSMSILYGSKPVTIWIDASSKVSRNRVSNDKLRAARKESERIKESFDYLFIPIGNLDRDSKEFIGLISDIIKS